MSKKVLNYAGRRPMLLALIMATAILGLLFSGWFTPTSGKAQTGQSNPQPNVETNDCVAVSTTSQCLSNAYLTLIASTNTPVVPLGSVVTLTATTNVIKGTIQFTTTYSNACSSCTNTCPNTTSNNCYNPIIVSNVWWEASVGSYSTNGKGLKASFKPTDCGSGSVTFHVSYTDPDPCDTNVYGADASGSFTVLALNIAGGGGIISSANGNNLAMVGQHINLTAQTCGGTFSNFQWTVPGYAIANYVTTTPSLLYTYFPTTNSDVSFYWVDGGAKNVSCSAVCGGVKCSTNVTITVTRPSVSLKSLNTMTWYGYGSLLGGVVGISLGDKSTLKDDLNYSVLINSPTDGYAQSVQIISLYAINGNNQVTGQQADGRVPYQDYAPTSIPKGGSRGSWISLEDAPTANGYWSSVTLAGMFDDFVMYQADINNTIYAPLGGNTIYVPLGQVKWNINGGFDGTTISPSYTSFSGPDNSTGFPIWTSIFTPNWHGL